MNDFWEYWEENARPPSIYVPTGLQPGYVKTCSFINWYGLRSPWCCATQPDFGITCCCANLMCVTPVDLRESDYFELLQTYVNPKCPEEFRGIYWLRDLTQHSSIITLHEADWNDQGNGGEKRFPQNWIKANTCYGLMSTCIFLYVADPCGAKLRFRVSPNRRWILFSYPLTWCGKDVCHVGPNQWIYVFPRNTTLRDQNGKTILLKKGDMMRIDYKQWDEPTSEITYNYIVHKLSWDEDKKTSSLRLLKARANKEYAEPYFTCDSNYKITEGLLPYQHLIRAIDPKKMSR